MKFHNLDLKPERHLHPHRPADGTIFEFHALGKEYINQQCKNVPQKNDLSMDQIQDNRVDRRFQQFH
jgi:hypothetical protein